VQCDDVDGVRHVRLAGALDVFTAGVVPERVFAGLPSVVGVIELDLSAVEFVDSAGLSAILRTCARARECGLAVRAEVGDASPLSTTVRAVLAHALGAAPAHDG
jgi:anti-anti-sigma factor